MLVDTWKRNCQKTSKKVLPNFLGVDLTFPYSRYFKKWDLTPSHDRHEPMVFLALLTHVGSLRLNSPPSDVPSPFIKVYKMIHSTSVQNIFSFHWSMWLPKCNHWMEIWPRTSLVYIALACQGKPLYSYHREEVKSHPRAYDTCKFLTISSMVGVERMVRR